MGIEGLRVGHGFDVHPWSGDPQRRLVLGGVLFDNHAGLEGHSDADVVSHACTDALLSAAGMGDIGTLFPDTDDGFANADSLRLLAIVIGRLGVGGWHPINVDITVIADSPKIAPQRDTMAKTLSEVVGAPVTVKGKRTEGLPGLAGGIQCHAAALVVKK